MSRTVAIGIQDFGDLIRKNYFYIDKTAFIKEWWESGQCNADYASPPFWKNSEYEYGGAFFFCPVRRTGKSV